MVDERIDKSLLILLEAIEAAENALVRDGDYNTLIELGKFHLVVMKFFDDEEAVMEYLSSRSDAK